MDSFAIFAFISRKFIRLNMNETSEVRSNPKVKNSIRKNCTSKEMYGQLKLYFGGGGGFPP